MSQLGANVTVRKTNTFQALLDRLRAVRFGCYIVWVHNWEVTRVATVAQPEKIASMIDEEQDKSASSPAPRAKSARKNKGSKSA